VEGLLAATGVAVVPGSMFGSTPGFRIAWGLPEDRLAEGLRLLGEHLDRG
jgi:aspartate/methionine/tyrosine aminotransferase